MPQAQETTPTPAPRRENVFDELGQTIETVETAPESGAPPADPALETLPAAAAKFRIGDREFATEAEALAFATSEIDTRDRDLQAADAYRQGLRDALAQQGGATASVTPAAPAAPALNHEELYTKPDEYLAKRDAMIEQRVLATVNQTQSLKTQSDNIWREFTDRHPEMADFRNEVETFVQANTTDVRSIISTKGRPASYDFIATKLKSRFKDYSAALQTKRALPNTGAGASPTEKAPGSVTPAPDAKKPLSFSEQIRSIRKRR